MSEPTGLALERHGPVVILRLDRPEARNALTYELMEALGGELSAADADPEVRVVVLTGTGDRSFCAGMDLKALTAGRAKPLDRDAMVGFDRLLHGRFSIPIIGAANGTAVGGGLELLLGCDLIVSSDQARFGLPEVKRGLMPGGNGTFVGRRIPIAVALELLLTGEMISADRAYQVGLVNAVVGPDEVLATALELAEKVTANAPLSVTAVKELAWLAGADPAAARQRLAEIQPAIFDSADAREGATAFIERRAPVWQGR